MKCLYGGLSLKGAFSRIAETSSADAFAADAGLLYRPQKNLVLSFALKNIGNVTKFIDKVNPLPFSGYLGAGWYMGSRKAHCMPAVGVTYNVADQTTVPEAGIELGTGIIAVDAGYLMREGNINVSFGFRPRPDLMTPGYAFIPGTYLDAAHRLNIEYRFSD